MSISLLGYGLWGGARRRARWPWQRTVSTAAVMEDRDLHLAQAGRRGGQSDLLRLEHRALAAPVRPLATDPEAAGKDLAESLRRMKADCGQVALAVPRELAVLRSLLLPMPERTEDLAAMVHFQIHKDLPFRPEDAVIDFFPLPGPASAGGSAAPAGGAAGEGAPKEAQGASVEVFAAVVKREVIAWFEKMAAAAGVRLAALGLESAAHARALAGLDDASDGSATALVRLRSRDVLIEVCQGPVLRFSKLATLSGGSEAAAEPARASANGSEAAADPAWGPAVRTEIIRGLHGYEGVPGHPPIQCVFVTGRTGGEAEVLAELTARHGLSARLLDEDMLRRQCPGAARIHPEGLGAAGLAWGMLDDAGLPLDFLHPRRPAAGRRNRPWTRWLLASLIGASLVGVWGIRSRGLEQRRRVQDQLRMQVEQGEKSRPLFREMRLKARVVEGWLNERRQWLDSCAHLSSLLPGAGDLYITSLSTGTKGTIYLAVRARSGDLLAQLDRQLRSAGYDLKPLAVTPSADPHGYGFQTTVELKLPEKHEVNVADLRAPERPANDASLDAAAARGRSAQGPQRAPPNEAPAEPPGPRMRSGPEPQAPSKAAPPEPQAPPKAAPPEPSGGRPRMGPGQRGASNASGGEEARPWRRARQ